MTAKNEGSNWFPESFRLTAFVESSNQSLEHVFWQKLFDEAPEEKIEQPKKPLVQESGQYEEANLMFANQLTRLDWHMTFDPSFDGLLSVPQSHMNGEPFRQLMGRWLADCPPLTRLAFGTVLLKSVESVQAGYAELSKLLPFKLDLDSSDFFYQINRPRKSIEIEELNINRMSKWSVARIIKIEMTSMEKAGQGISKEYAFCRLELDISTSGDRKKPLPKEKLVSELEELIALSTEISINGDCK